MAPVNPGSQPNRAPTSTHGINFLTSLHGHGISQVPGSQWARTTYTSGIFLHWPTPTVQDILIGLRHPINDHKPVSRGQLLTPDAGGPQCQVDCYSRLLMHPNTKSSLVAQMVKHLPTMWETRVWSLGQEDPLEKERATHSRTLAWKIPWTEEPGRLQSMGLQRVGHAWVTSLHFNTKSPKYSNSSLSWMPQECPYRLSAQID